MLILFSAYQVSHGRDRGHLTEFLFLNPWSKYFLGFFFVEMVSIGARLCGKDGGDSFTRCSEHLLLQLI